METTGTQSTEIDDLEELIRVLRFRREQVMNELDEAHVRYIAICERLDSAKIKLARKKS